MEKWKGDGTRWPSSVQSTTLSIHVLAFLDLVNLPAFVLQYFHTLLRVMLCYASSARISNVLTTILSSFVGV